jgi:nucleoside-diphosphate-sugar epimerase
MPGQRRRRLHRLVNLLAAESSVGGAINIGRGGETSVLELVDALNELGPAQMEPPEFAARRAVEIRRSCLDCARGRAWLGWEAVTDLLPALERLLASARPGSAGASG